MREILFRGKRIDNGEWVVGKPWIFAPPVNKAVIVYAMGLVGEDDDVSRYCECHEVNPSTISEFTGLTDKNGKKIFEGDVIRFNGISYMVKFFKNIARFAAYRPCFDSQKYGLADCCSFSMSESIIIGNIHDTPELLEEQT